MWRQKQRKSDRFMKTSGKTRIRLSPEEREKEILKYTAEIVAQEGVFAVSIEKIGKALNISKSTVYSYFPSTTELLQKLFLQEMRSLRAKQNAAIEKAKTIEQLVRGITHAYLNYIDEKGLLISRLQAEPSLISFGGPTDYARQSAINHLAKTISEACDIPMAIAIPATDISFGLPEAAGHCLNRKVTDKQTIEDLTVAMILASIKATKDNSELNFKSLPEQPLNNKKPAE